MASASGVFDHGESATAAFYAAGIDDTSTNRGAIATPSDSRNPT